MEIQAALEAVRALDRAGSRCVSDSTYVVNCFRDRWWEGWLARGWLNKAQEAGGQPGPVGAARSSWYRQRGDVTFRWVKGHSGDAMNDLVDRLAVEAAATQEGRSGDGHAGRTWARPTRPRAGAAASTAGAGACPDGHLVLVAGLPAARARRLRRQPGGRRGPSPAGRDPRGPRPPLHPDLVVVTGLGLGAEQLGAEAAVEAGHALRRRPALPRPRRGVARAHPGPLPAAPGRGRRRGHPPARRPTSRQQAGGGDRRRDAWLARSVAEAVVVWDGEDERVGRLVRSLVVQLGEEEVWVVEPG